jgi:hypothetical protein
VAKALLITQCVNELNAAIASDVTASGCTVGFPLALSQGNYDAIAFCCCLNNACADAHILHALALGHAGDPLTHYICRCLPLLSHSTLGALALALHFPPFCCAVWGRQPNEASKPRASARDSRGRGTGVLRVVILVPSPRLPPHVSEFVQREQGRGTFCGGGKGAEHASERTGKKNPSVEGNGRKKNMTTACHRGSE